MACVTGANTGGGAAFELSPRKPFSWRFVTPLYVGSALNPINSTAIATALVGIAAAMGISVGRVSILVSVLYLSCDIAQPTAGKLSEESGRGGCSSRGS
jgi:MFS family permease